MSEKVPFRTIFVTKPNGSVTTNVRIRIGGIVVNPGVTFSAGQAIAGIDLTQFKDRDLGIDNEDGTYVIRGIF